jgi:hypothetical protein
MDEQAAEEVVDGAKSTPRALKREHIIDEQAARLKSCPSPNPRESELFRSL